MIREMCSVRSSISIEKNKSAYPLSLRVRPEMNIQRSMKESRNKLKGKAMWSSTDSSSTHQS